jgi:site-specific DNA-adenine methylase
MEIKLIKTEVNYLLKNEEGVIIASTSIKKGISSLSKQNCDEIFRVVDVGKLTQDSYQKYSAHDNKISLDEQIQRSGGFIVGFKEGFNKAMELNKDKVFTLEDIDKAIEWATINGRKGNITHYDIDNFIQSLQQPTEIEVMIVMECCGKVYSQHCDGTCVHIKPHLDSEGQSILKKI